MSKSFNSVTIMGNLTRDPELRTTPNGKSVTNITVALNRPYKEGSEWKETTDYIDVQVWDKLAEQAEQHLSKGQPVFVSGRLQSRSWEQDGQKRVKTEVVAHDIKFLGASDN